jgi:osmotically-inducible protein OsmY
MITHRDDIEILNDVLNTLSHHSDLGKEPIDVTVHRGAVELTGRVSTVPVSTAAVDIVRHIDGVINVINNLGTTSTEPDESASDRELSRYVLRLLEWCEGVPSGRVRTEIRNGCVTLFGMVTSREISEEIEQGIRLLPGVRGVVNRIDIQ